VTGEKEDVLDQVRAKPRVEAITNGVATLTKSTPSRKRIGCARRAMALPTSSSQNIHIR
jgi:hypothetical protein